MLNPFLLVGVGGSGGKTLRVIREELMLRLKQAGWTKDDLPKAWQFLHVDVPTHADGEDVDLPPQLPDRQYRGIVAPGVDYAALDRALLSKATDKPVRDSLATWRPNQTDVKQAPQKGAGQYRALGRMITLTGLEGIQRAIQQAKAEMMGTGAKAELQEVATLLGATPGDPNDPFVVVVSSIAGGTGAGAVIDVCDVIRAMPETWANQSFGFLYAPDVFNSLPEEARKGVRANALGSLAELMNGYWNNTGPSESTGALFNAYQVNLNTQLRNSGPRYPFIVGSANENVIYTNQNDVYLAMGRSLASWVASEKLQDTFGAYITGNWTAINGSADKLPLRSDNSEQGPFMAIGSARVGLGRDRFLKYASQHLARGAVERFVAEHEANRAGLNDDRTSQQLIADLEQARRGGFRSATGLDELGPNNNAVLDKLHANVPAAGNEFMQRVTKGVTQLVSTSGRKGASANDVMQRVIGDVRQNQGEISGRLESESRVKASAWVNDIQDQIAQTVARSIGENGAPLTRALLNQLILTMGEICDELSAEADGEERKATALEQRTSESFSTLGRTYVTTATDGTVQKAAKDAISAQLARYEAWLRRFARDIIRDLTAGFLTPLARAVGDAGDKLAVARSKEDSFMARWPVGDVVPHLLRPAPNEFLLQGTDEYPTILRDLVARTIGTDTEPDAARRLAEMQVLPGAPTHTGEGQQLIKITDRWVPKDHTLTPEFGASPRNARFAINDDPEMIAQRAEEWLNREGTAAGRYMQEGLGQYLSGDSASPAELERRLQQFEGKVVSALDAAAPLAKINPAVLVAVHGKDRISHSLRVSEIPLPEGSEAKARLRKVFERRGDWNDEVGKSFVDGKSGHIDFFTHLNEAYQPVVFDSLMRPIAEDWGQKSKTPESHREFWKWRRARPIAEFVPVARSEYGSVLEAMVRGWFVAGRLGQMRLTQNSVEIWLPETTNSAGRWARFPSPTLSLEDMTGPDGLAVILASIMVALLEVNQRAAIDPILPYTRLRELGELTGRSAEINRELRDWLVNGKNSLAALERNTETPLERQKTAEKVLSNFYQGYVNHFDQIEHDYKNPTGFPRSWDLRKETLSVLEGLIRGVQALESTTTSAVQNTGSGGWA
ncbi:MAG: tubulin-like doman-containing protein [Cellulomonadaceae bacterium]|jgi:hypothetical protein|nr:tubulin-like doman-containing protein [Cellulomonadaceae bacterium]